MKNAIDFNTKVNQERENRRLICLYITLSKDDIINALKSEAIIINNVIYEVPVRQLCEMIIDESFDEPTLFELIEYKEEYQKAGFKSGLTK